MKSLESPRGEMGTLPDDAKQDLRIKYLQEEVIFTRGCETIRNR